jgi:predicted nucleic acid-binding protein
VTFTGPSRVVVLDASFAVDVAGGAEPYRDRVGAWLDADADILVPPHFWAETANALLFGLRLQPTDVAIRVERLSALGLETADRGIVGLSEAIDLAVRHGLAVYDALYLQLALDVDGELATRHNTLARAGRAEGLEVVS